MKLNKRVIGIDIGYDRCGWAVVSYTFQGVLSYEPVDYGIIQTTLNQSIYYRINEIALGISDIIDQYQPDELAIESLFYFKNIKTATDVLHARGVVIHTCFVRNICVYEYTPLQVKQSVTGYGRSAKKYVQKSVQSIYKLNEVPRPDDVADALAICFCHINVNTIYKKLND